MSDHYRLIILTDSAFGAILSEFISRAIPGLDVSIVFNAKALAREAASLPLIGFLTRHYVEPALCKRGGCPAYNIHPGPPNYPGWMPEIRATRDRAPTFGATLHEMTPVIDAGPIIATETMAADDAADSDAYARIGFECALVLLGRYARAIAAAGQPLSPSGQTWTGPLMLRAQVEALMARKID